MRLFSKEAWSYAVLLIILCSIATVAVLHTISYLDDYVSGEAYHVLVFLLWSISLGFMLITGAFGLWTIQFSSESESRRRIGRFVDAMDYLSDGLLTVDRKGRITGSNPKARDMTKSSLEKMEPLEKVFTCLSKDDVAILLDENGPNEVEREFPINDSTKAVRFRSQPSEDLTLMLVSDVSSMKTQQQRSRQIARLQLIGQLARGVAHDFNNLLCGISGYTSLIKRVQPGSQEMTDSIEAIRQNTDRGITIAGHLMELAQPGSTSQFTEMVKDHVTTASEILKSSLPPDWQVRCEASNTLPPVALTGIQVEQIVVNLGLLAADSVSRPSVIKIALSLPDPKSNVFKVDRKFAGVIIVGVESITSARSDETVLIRPASDSGAIESVVKSLIEEAGGALENLITSKGMPIYRVSLPHGVLATEIGDAEQLPQELVSYISGWSILLASSADESSNLAKRMKSLNINTEQVNSITSALAKMEEEQELDAMILDELLLGQEAKGLLKAILKLHPSAGVVVLSEQPDSQPSEFTADIVFESSRANPDKILMSAVEARTLALRRKKHQA